MKRLLPILVALTILTILAVPTASLLLSLIPIRPPASFREVLPPADNPPVRLYDEASRRLLTLPLERYLEGVVAAEMPASFHPHALRAQAVVARTYVLRRLWGLHPAGCPEAPDADICSDPSRGQAWISPAEMRRRWGTWAAIGYRRKIREAVAATRGLVLAHGGLPIDAVYHAASGGRTEDARYAWGRVVPYLRSVLSPFEEGSRYDRTRVDLPLADVAARLALDPQAVARGLDAEVLERSPSGRVLRARVGERTFTGAFLRERLQLPSTLFTWQVRGDRLAIEVRGYGHGVGMSQYGAQGMALRGYGFREILEHFYPGARLVSLREARDRRFPGT